MSEGKYYTELFDKGSSFLRFLYSKGIKGTLGDSYKYMIKLDIEGIGDIPLYYKPTEKTFKLTFNELSNNESKTKMKELWEDFIGIPDRKDTGNEPIKAKKINLKKEEVLPKESAADSGLNWNFCAYVDGSYINKKIGYGAVIIQNGKIEKSIYGPVKDPLFLTQRQIGGELTAVIEVLKWCRKNHIESIQIFFDYLGIMNWPERIWQAKTKATKTYMEYVENSEINISWIKVKSHSGNKWNEKADELAQKGALSSPHG